MAPHYHLQLGDANGSNEFDGFESEFVHNADGSYTIENFLNSGAPLTFVTTPIVADSYNDISFVGNVDTEQNSGIAFIKNLDGTDASIKVFNTNGTTLELERAYVAQDGYSYIYATTTEEGLTYSGSIYASGFVDGWDDNAFYVTFDFDDNTFSGIDTIDNDSTNNCVEYFNLQGVRIDNPENGIYIRRQGSKVSKVMVK